MTSSRLSPRQREIANLIADGNKAPAIATLLGIGVGSVRTQISRLKRKKGLRTQLDISKYVRDNRDRKSAKQRIYNDIQTSVSS